MKTTLLLTRKTVFLLFIGLSSLFSGCSSNDDEVVPKKTDEYMSFKINGKDFTGEAVSLGDADYFHAWGVVEINATDGYSVQLEMAKPKVGTFTMPKDRFIATIATLKGTVLNPNVQGYDMPASGKGTLTFSQLDSEGYAEGTFAFTGQNDNGQKLEVTDGKFRVDLR